MKSVDNTQVLCDQRKISIGGLGQLSMSKEWIRHAESSTFSSNSASVDMSYLSCVFRRWCTWRESSTLTLLLFALNRQANDRFPTWRRERMFLMSIVSLVIADTLKIVCDAVCHTFACLSSTCSLSRRESTVKIPILSHWRTTVHLFLFSRESSRRTISRIRTSFVLSVEQSLHWHEGNELIINAMCESHLSLLDEQRTEISIPAACEQRLVSDAKHWTRRAGLIQKMPRFDGWWQSSHPFQLNAIHSS